MALAPLSASPRRVDLGKRADLLEQSKTFDTRNPRPELNTTMNGKTIEMKEWHSEFSSLGQRRSTLQDDRLRLTEEVMEKDNWEKKNVQMQISPQNRRKAKIGNWNNLKEQVMSQKFTGTELRTPEGRRFQQMVDEISLRDINRFQDVKNKTDDGIPSIKPASGETLTSNSSN